MFRGEGFGGYGLRPGASGHWWNMGVRPPGRRKPLDPVSNCVARCADVQLLANDLYPQTAAVYIFARNALRSIRDEEYIRTKMLLPGYAEKERAGMPPPRVTHHRHAHHRAGHSSTPLVDALAATLSTHPIPAPLIETLPKGTPYERFKATDHFSCRGTIG